MEHASNYEYQRTGNTLSVINAEGVVNDCLNRTLTLSNQGSREFRSNTPSTGHSPSP